MSRLFHAPKSYSAFLSTLIAVTVSSLVANAWSANRFERQQQAERLVREALSHESLGLDQTSQQLLATAEETAPDFPPVNWHQGRVRIGNQWMGIDQTLESANDQRLRETYERQRDKAVDNVVSQMALADWCAQRNLAAQERAHLNRVIQLEPNHLLARRRLNQRQVAGRWVAMEDLWQGVRDQKSNQESIQRWQDRLLRISRALDDKSGKRFAAMREELESDLDSEAIPAIEAILATRNEASAELAVELLGGIPSCDSSRALTRIAVMVVWPEVRNAATAALKTRPFDHYVPILLAELSTPIESRVDTALIGGQLLYRHVFEQELQDRRQRAILDTAAVRRPSLVTTTNPGTSIVDPGATADVIAGAAAETRARAMADMQQTAVMREQMRLRRNMLIFEMNERIGRILGEATGQELPPSPEAWWAWWDEENGVELAGEKFVDIRYNRDVEIYEDQIEVTITGSEPSGGSSPAPQRCECFVAGTPVWTIAGPKPIEEIEIGDRVLSQDPETGELAFKPVLQTTVRPAESLYKATLTTSDRETLEGSGGHPLWVSGEGWVMLRDLQSGAILHTIGGSAIVSVVDEGSEAETYNLVVDDFHTYVVGESRVVCHDNTPRRATDAIVPGLIPQ